MRRRNKEQAFRNLVEGRVEPSNELGEDTQSWKSSAFLGEYPQWKQPTRVWMRKPWHGEHSSGKNREEGMAEERKL